MNKAWHRAHQLPVHATLAQRTAWGVRYDVAVSLDGLIAGLKGDYDWIVMDPAIDFGAMYREFDAR